MTVSEAKKNRIAPVMTGNDEIIRTFVARHFHRYNEARSKDGGACYVQTQNDKRIVELNLEELRLAKHALLEFRNKLIAEGKPTEDVNELLLKIMK